MPRKPQLKQPLEPKEPKRYPYPEVLAHTGAWDISESPKTGGFVDACASKFHRKMLVPLDDDPRARAVRLHELSHVKWSPYEIPQEAVNLTSHEALLACEDGRVNTLLGLEFEEWAHTWDPEVTDRPLAHHFSWPEEDTASVKACMATDNLYAAALQILCGLMTSREMDATRALREWYQEARATDGDAAHKHITVTRAVELAKSFIQKEPYDFKSTVKAAMAIDYLKPERKRQRDADKKAARDKAEEGKSEYDKMVEKQANRTEGKPDEDEAEEAPPTAEEIEKAVEEAMPDEGEKSEEETPEDKDVEKSGVKPELPDGDPFANIEWGRVDFEYPPLTRHVPIHKIGKGARVQEEGVVPVRMDRLMSDGKIFRARRKHYGGAVLIDQSGSMSLSQAEVEAIVLAAPTVVVGSYAGDHVRGILRILASKGRMAEGKDLFIGLGGNTIDYPALVWLAEQPEPRIWVSDGHVIPKPGSGGYGNARKQCADQCRKNRIVRLEDSAEAIEFLGKLR